MSETDQPDQAPDTTLPTLRNLTVKEAIRAGGGVQVTVLEVTFGSPLRTLEVRALDLGEQFDLAELTGPNMANAVWVNMAQMAASVRAMDGVPRPGVMHTRDSIKATLNKLGVDGLQAVMMALNGYRGAGLPDAPPVEAGRAAVGN